MAVLMLFSLICFCLIKTLCIESMSMFNVSSKKRMILFISGSSAIILTTTLVLRLSGIAIDFSPAQYYGFVGLWMATYSSLLYKKITKGIIAGVCSSLILFGIEGLAALFFRVLGYAHVQDVAPLHWNAAFFSTIAIMLALVHGAKRVLKKRIDMNIFNSRSMYLVMAISGIMIILSYINYIEEQLDASGDIMYALFFVAVIAMFGIIVRYLFKENALRTEKLIAEASRNYINDLEASYAALRAIKHDYANIMSSFKLYIDNGDMVGLAKYYNDDLSEMNNDLLQQDRLLGSLQNVRINEVKSILIYKCSMAAQRQIDTGIEAREPVDELGVSTAIVCQVLGVLLDNAIEAAAEAGDRNLGIAIVKNPKSATFIIKNTWEQQDISMDRLYELGFSTKGSGRGVGLYTVRNYTNKISNLYLETELDSGYFTQILTVKDAR